LPAVTGAVLPAVTGAVLPAVTGAALPAVTGFGVPGLTGHGWAAVLLLAAAAAVVASRRWGDRTDRLSRLVPHGRPEGPPSGRRLAELARAVRALPERRHRRVAAAGGAAVGVCAGLLFGPVAGVVAATYAGCAGHAAVRALRDRERRRGLARAIEAVGMLAADLRAGVPVPIAVEASRVELGACADVADRVRAATAVADRTGAPLADVLDRLDADLRAGVRLRAAGAAQAAGARVSAWLLAVLPLAGVALGPAIGADTTRVLLHTPLGAACLGVAVGLQLGGLAWSARLARAAS
jgi:tight adherence protein B